MLVQRLEGRMGAALAQEKKVTASPKSEHRAGKGEFAGVLSEPITVAALEVNPFRGHRWETLWLASSPPCVVRM